MKSLSKNFEEVRLVYRNPTLAKDRPKISGSNDVYRILMQAWDLDRIQLVEEFKLLMLDRGLRLMSISEISVGGTSRAVIDPKIVFVTALKRRAHALILAHNHPSGQLKPSEVDISLTNRLVAAGRLLDLEILDHVIISDQGFYSMADQGDIKYSKDVRNYFHTNSPGQSNELSA